MRIQQFDFSIDLLQAILWQYDNSTKIRTLIENKNTWYQENQEQFWQDWYTNVFNLQTANIFGLSVWSIILGIPMYINLVPDNDQPVFGFNESDGMGGFINDNENFENGNFSSSNNIITLTLEEQRLILRLKYYQLVSRGAIPEINNILRMLFAPYVDADVPAAAWVLDGLDMSMTYVFNFNVPNNFMYLFRTLDILPRPAGVLLKYIIMTDQVFGFNESDGVGGFINNNKNFENGNFPSES